MAILVVWLAGEKVELLFLDDVGFGMARMFQMLGESTRPLFHVVRTLNEALEALGVES